MSITHLHDGLRWHTIDNKFRYNHIHLPMAPGFITEHFRLIERELADLSANLKQLPCRLAHIAQIPAIAKGSENEPVSQITVTQYSSHQAISIATDCYRDLHIQPLLSQKAARRTAGILYLAPSQIGPNACAALLQQVDRINTAKQAVQEFVISHFHDRYARFEALRAECPGVMTLHLYRQLRCYAEGNIDSVRFSWIQKDSLFCPDKNGLLEQLYQHTETAGPDQLDTLNELIRRVINTQGAALRMRRSVRVQPVANIVSAGKVKTVTAPMPLILLQDCDAQIKMLNSFDASMQRKRRSDKSESTRLGTFNGISIEALKD
ncbi:MAG: DNA replication terminus site-binding protein [Shewanella sp.]